MPRVVTFGEMLVRLQPPGYERLRQARAFEIVFGGAEANVAVSLATFGLDVQYITRLPDNELAEACLGFLRQHGVGTQYVLRGGDRVGLYFIERGAAQRGSTVVYDRADSSFATIEPAMVNWRAALTGADWFHWTGISPAVAMGVAEVCCEAIAVARELNLRVSCDLNYRHSLWRWGKPAAEVMPALAEQCDVVIGNAETVETLFGIAAPRAHGTDAAAIEEAVRVAEELAARYPRLSTIALTLRGSASASHNTWSGILWHRGAITLGPRYDLVPIVDRVGGGDAFTAGLMYGLHHAPEDPAYALNFALAAGCLKHTIPGDSNLVTVAEVEQVMTGDVAGRIKR